MNMPMEAALLRTLKCGGLAARAAGGCQPPPVAGGTPDDRRPGPWGGHTGSTDHGRRFGRLRRRRDQGDLRLRVPVPGRCGCRQRRHLLHLPAVVLLHPAWRALHRVDAREPEVHGAADRHHRRAGGRRREPRRRLRVPRAVAAGARRTVGLGGHRVGSCHRAVALHARGGPVVLGSGTAGPVFRLGRAAISANS